MDIVEYGGVITLDDVSLFEPIEGTIFDEIDMNDFKRECTAYAKAEFNSLSYGKQNRAKRKLDGYGWVMYLMSLDEDGR